MYYGEMPLRGKQRVTPEMAAGIDDERRGLRTLSLLSKPLSVLLLGAALIRNEGRKPETETEKDLVVEEYKACRDLIGRNIDIIEKTETYVVGACAAIFVYSIDKGDNLLTLFAAWLPLILALVGRARYLALDATIDKINQYLIQQEKTYHVIGYSNYYQNLKSSRGLGSSRNTMWTILIISSSVFALYKTYAIWNPLKEVCDTHPRSAFLCRPVEPAKN